MISFHKFKWTSPFQTDRETTRDAFSHHDRRGSPKRDWLRSEGGSARRERRAEGKLPVSRKLRRRGRGQFAGNASGPVNLNQRESGVEQRHANRRDDEPLALLRKIGSGSQRAAGLVAVAGSGNGRAMRMLLRATLLFAEQSRGIDQAARKRRQPKKRQQHRHDWLDPLHGESNTTAARPEQCGLWAGSPARSPRASAERVRA